jgi:hypothetical protein
VTAHPGPESTVAGVAVAGVARAGVVPATANEQAAVNASAVATMARGTDLRHRRTSSDRFTLLLSQSD